MERVAKRHAAFAVALLFGVNFLNFIDRYVIAAVSELIKADFGLGDDQVGLIGSMFMVAYMVASPFAGILADQWPRRYFVAGGVVIWSVATFLSGLAHGYHSLLTARSFIGIGEAGFAGVAPTLISDFFPKEKRGRMLAFFYVAIPVGSALGYVLGGYVGHRWGWREAFFLAGAPGVVLGLLALRMAEPPRGAGDGVAQGAERTFRARSALELLKNRTFLFTCLGMSGLTFSLGGMAFWFPAFFVRFKGVKLDEANLLFGAITVVAGLLGTFLGGFLGDYCLRFTKRSYLLVSGLGMLLAIPPGLIALTATDRSVYIPAVFAAELFVFLNTGPANAVLVSVVLPEIRATAIALSIFVYHLLGDAPSPILIGWFSDWTGSLKTALLLTTVAMGVSGVFFLVGSKTLGEDTARVLKEIEARGPA